MPLSPPRLWRVFRVLHTVFCRVRRRERWLGLRPLPPEVLRATLLALGTAFLKLGQVLATRADFFSPEDLAALKTIHDDLAPMPEADFRHVFRLAFGEGEAFREFETTPLASASIGQVHRAALRDGTVVAVKLRRRGIQRQVRADIRVLRGFLLLFSPFFSSLTRNSLEAVIDEFAHMIVKEADMAVELDHLQQFREAYGDFGVTLPEPFPALCSREALVMRFETGLRIDDRAGLERLDIDFRRLMDTLVAFYVEQMLVRGLFHCDPHPGNLLVRPDGRLVLLDYGMVKRLSRTTRVAMIEVAKSAHERELDTFVAACKRLGVIAPAAPEPLMLEFAERMFRIFSDDSLSSLDMQTLALETLASMRELPFKLPQEVVYVTRVSSLVEGIGASHIENFNGVKDILPVLFANLPRALGRGESLWGSLRDETLGLPLQWRRLKSVLLQLSESSLEVKLSRETLDLAGDLTRRALRPLGEGALLMAGGFFLLAWGERDWAAGAFLLGMVRAWMGMR